MKRYEKIIKDMVEREGIKKIRQIICNENGDCKNCPLYSLVDCWGEEAFEYLGEDCE